MRFKYYLRGLGLGILAATVVLMISFKIHDKKVTDTDIISRAKELGMVFPEDLPTEEDSSKEGGEPASEGEKKDTQEPDASKEPESQPEAGPEVKNPADEEGAPGQENPGTTPSESGGEPQPDPEASQGSAPVAPVPETPPTENVIITVETGDYCRQIAAKLLAQGLIQDADDFCKYMGEKDLDNAIPNGTFEIPRGADYETIGKILNPPR